MVMNAGLGGWGAVFAVVVAELAALATGVVVAAPPRVIEASPDHGDVGVDPRLTQIRVRFDQDMNDSGHSVCRMGNTFPTIEGKVTWTDSRTVVVPVKLEPGTTYSIGVNCPAAGNFKSVQGESAEPYLLTFRTLAPGETAPAALTAESAKACVTELRKAIDERYSYRDLRNVNWDEAFAEYRERLESAATPSAFARQAARMLARAQDLHMTVKVGEVTLPTGTRSVPYNFDFKRVQALAPNLTKTADSIHVGRFDDGVGYVLFTACNGRFATGQAVAKALDVWVAAGGGGCPGVVIDVRPNSGGDELIAREVASLFTKETRTYSKHRIRDPKLPDGWSAAYERKTNPPFEGRKPFEGKVAVLVGPGNMSSAESFILMMREAAGARLFGEKTYGSSGNPRPVELSCGVTLMVPSWQDMFPDGTPLEGVGIKPDVVVPWTAAGSADPVLDAALKWIRE